MIYQYEIQVRGYELDSFGHVNNAVYLNYLEEARWNILKDKNIWEYFYKHNQFLVVAEATIRYSKELKLFDQLIIQTTLQKEEPYLLFKQKIINKKTGDITTKATIKTLLVDKNRVPHDIPDFFLE